MDTTDRAIVRPRCVVQTGGGDPVCRSSWYLLFPIMRHGRNRHTVLAFVCCSFVFGLSRDVQGNVAHLEGNKVLFPVGHLFAMYDPTDTQVNAQECSRLSL